MPILPGMRNTQEQRFQGCATRLKRGHSTRPKGLTVTKTEINRPKTGLSSPEKNGALSLFTPNTGRGPEQVELPLKLTRYRAIQHQRPC